MHQNVSVVRLISMENRLPSTDLKKTILQGIAQVEMQRAKAYFAITVFVLPISLGGLYTSGYYVLQSFYSSGFYDYLSLLFSGDFIVFDSWKELSYSLIETVPIFGIVVFLITLILMVWSGAHILNKRSHLTLIPQ